MKDKKAGKDKTNWEVIEKNHGNGQKYTKNHADSMLHCCGIVDVVMLKFRPEFQVWNCV
jgi:hypothetical protein